MDKVAEIKTKPQSLIVKLQLIIAVLAVMAPVFYIIGLSFNQGYLITFGISTDIFPFSIQDAYISAYLAISHLLIALSNWAKEVFIELFTTSCLYWLIGGFLVISSALYLRIKQLLPIKYEPLKKIISFLKNILIYLNWNTNHGTAAIGTTGLFAYLIFTLLIIAFSAYALWLWPIALGYSPGKELAKRSIDSFLTKGCHFEKDERWSNCKVLQSKDGKMLYEGILIANSETRIAFFTKSGAIVTQIPDGAVIINTPKDL